MVEQREVIDTSPTKKHYSEKGGHFLRGQFWRSEGQRRFFDTSMRYVPQVVVDRPRPDLEWFRKIKGNCQCNSVRR